MKIPYNWLKDYVNVGNKSPEDVAKKLTIAGLEVVLIEKIGGDSIFDIEVTPNRPDCLCMLGIAREVASVLGKRVKAPKLKTIKPKPKTKPYIEIKDKKLCSRYTGRIIRNIKVGPSPQWLVKKLQTLDLRPVNNVVDITNFCLFELGQPTHAFDYDKLKGKITVGRAHKDEKIVTIDGKERTLQPDMLVIRDEEKPVALGGVMGSKDTEVTERTTNILFESAYFDPISIRKTSRGLGLISESSYRFERSVDKGGIVTTSDRACSLIKELCGGEIGSLTDVGEKNPKKTKIRLRMDRLQKILGIEIPISSVKKIFTALQIKIESFNKKAIVVSAPSFRQDLKYEEDLIEEIIRVYGYERLPSTMPAIVGHPRRIEREREITTIVRNTTASMGIDEILTYSLISKEDLNGLDDSFKKDTVIIKNPLSIEQEIMRPTLISGILRTASWNLNRRERDFRIFELGAVYSKIKEQYKEGVNLSIAFVGDNKASKEESIFFDMKGMLACILGRLGIKEVQFKNKGFPTFLTGAAASIELKGETIGFIGKVAKDTLDKFDVETDLFLCELSLDKLFGHASLEKRFHQIPKFPSANRDISMTVKKEVLHHDIVSIIKEAGGELVAKIRLFDQYFGIQIPDGYKGLAYSVEYRAKDRTLMDEEVTRLHGAVCDALIQKLEAKIR